MAPIPRWQAQAQEALRTPLPGGRGGLWKVGEQVQSGVGGGGDGGRGVAKRAGKVLTANSHRAATPAKIFRELALF